MSDADSPIFRCGDTVRWTSQSAGRTSTKTGTIVAVVPAGVRPARQRVAAAENRARLARLFDLDGDAYAISKLGGGFSRETESYLVAVEGPSERSKPRLYWPRVERLESAS